MNFIEAVQFARSGLAVKRIGWADGVRLSVNVNKGSGFRDDEIIVYHIATCAISLTATDVLAHDWELVYTIPSWFRISKNVRCQETTAVYTIVAINESKQEWDGCNDIGSYRFSLHEIEKIGYLSSSSSPPRYKMKFYVLHHNGYCTLRFTAEDHIKTCTSTRTR